MDIADRSDDRIQHAIEDGIREARRASGMKPTGFCLYCNEAVPPAHLFCCVECSTDWHWEQDAKRRNGK